MISIAKRWKLSERSGYPAQTIGLPKLLAFDQSHKVLAGDLSDHGVQNILGEDGAVALIAVEDVVEGVAVGGDQIALAD